MMENKRSYEIANRPIGKIDFTFDHGVTETITIDHDFQVVDEVLDTFRDLKEKVQYFMKQAWHETLNIDLGHNESFSCVCAKIVSIKFSIDYAPTVRFIEEEQNG